MAASVNRKANIVAMSGAIMPEPLAMPLIVTLAPAIVAVRVTALANVSVVRIASAASFQLVGFTSLAMPGRVEAMASGARGWPMTPVEAMNTSVGRQPKIDTAAFTVVATVKSPAFPVNAFE